MKAYKLITLKMIGHAKPLSPLLWHGLPSPIEGHVIIEFKRKNSFYGSGYLITPMRYCGFLKKVTSSSAK